MLCKEYLIKNKSIINSLISCQKKYNNAVQYASGLKKRKSEMKSKEESLMILREEKTLSVMLLYTILPAVYSLKKELCTLITNCKNFGSVWPDGVDPPQPVEKTINCDTRFELNKRNSE